jgi:hypothetical protein
VPANGTAGGWTTRVDTVLCLADRRLRVVCREHRNGRISWSVSSMPPDAPPLDTATTQWLREELEGIGLRYGEERQG